MIVCTSCSTRPSFFEGFDSPEPMMPLNRGLKNPRPSMFEDFDPQEATAPFNRGFKNPRPSLFEDFDPPEATTPLKKGFQNTRPSISEDFGPTTPLKRGFKNSRTSFFEDFDPPETTTSNSGLKSKPSIFSIVEPKRRACVRGWARARPGTSARVILAWVYKSSAGLPDKLPKSRQAPNIEFRARKTCD